MARIFVYLLFFFIVLPCYSGTISGNVRQDEYLSKQSQVVDYETQKPVSGAKIYLPKYDFSTVTDNNGKFELNAQIDDKAIMQIEKNGYRPFSLTVDKMILNSPLKLGIQKIKMSDVFIDSGVFHLGDDIYSVNSANCRQFKAKPIGPFYSKKINLPKIAPTEQAVIIFGSIIGLDTKRAKDLGQNAIVAVYSSPLVVYFNGQKIGEISLNGDNQQIIIPDMLLDTSNEITVHTGKNLFQYLYIDYDDMEFANLRIEIQSKAFANK